MPSAEPSRVSVIIVNWNTRDLLLQCLRTLSDSTCIPDYEVIVVDNASTDGSAEAVSEHYPDAKLVRSGTNLGFAAGNNVGLCSAECEYILLLNPDTLVHKGAVESMMQFLAAHEEAGVVGCKLLNADGTYQESYWTSFPDLRWLFRHSLYLNKIGCNARRRIGVEEAQPQRVAHLLGACMMMRRTTMEELGGFDESYFLYMEETDLCYRISQQGLGVYFLPTASITHLGQRSSNQAAEWTNTQLGASTYRFIRDHGTSGVGRLLLKPILLLGALVRLSLWCARYVTGSADRRLAVRMLRGYRALCWQIPKF